MRTRDVIAQSVSELQELLKEIEGDDDADLEEYATLFDTIAQRADETANLLGKANTALQGEQEGALDEGVEQQGDKAKPQGNQGKEKQASKK